MIHTLRGRKFDYLKICKNVLIEIKENAFSMNHFGQKKYFLSMAGIFSKFLDGI